MKVGIFYNSISNPKKFPNKIQLMENFKAGVQITGDMAVDFYNNVLPDDSLDAGFVLGYTLENNFRRKIIDRLRELGKPSIFVDSNILHYARQEHEWHRYSLNSVYPNEGTYLFGALDLTKWQRFSSWHGVRLKPWRETGTHILILGQRPKGWNMFGKDQTFWMDSMISAVQSRVPNRPIRIRMHPGDGTRSQQKTRLQKTYGRSIQISDAENIRSDLKDCWCVIGYNSTPNVVAALEGIPVYLSDPSHSWAADVAFQDINQIVKPVMPDRQEWVHKLANIHWSNEEVRSGILWSAIKNHINNIGF
jgi:hypothetical protein